MAPKKFSQSPPSQGHQPPEGSAGVGSNELPTLPDTDDVQDFLVDDLREDRQRDTDDVPDTVEYLDDLTADPQHGAARSSNQSRSRSRTPRRSIAGSPVLIAGSPDSIPSRGSPVAGEEADAVLIPSQDSPKAGGEAGELSELREAMNLLKEISGDALKKNPLEANTLAQTLTLVHEIASRALA